MNRHLTSAGSPHRTAPSWSREAGQFRNIIVASVNHRVRVQEPLPQAREAAWISGVGAAPACELANSQRAARELLEGPDAGSPLIAANRHVAHVVSSRTRAPAAAGGSLA